MSSFYKVFLDSMLFKFMIKVFCWLFILIYNYNSHKKTNDLNSLQEPPRYSEYDIQSVSSPLTMYHISNLSITIFH